MRESRGTTCYFHGKGAEGDGGTQPTIDLVAGSGWVVMIVPLVGNHLHIMIAVVEADSRGAEPAIECLQRVGIGPLGEHKAPDQPHGGVELRVPGRVSKTHRSNEIHFVCEELKAHL